MAHRAFLTTTQVPKDEIQALLPYAGFWAYHMSSFFLQAYLEKATPVSFLPEKKEDLDIMLKTYLLEGALHDVTYELNHRPDYVMVPLELIRSILGFPKAKKSLP